MLPDGASQELAAIEALIGQAEAELAALGTRPDRERHAADPSDPFDPVGCLEIWLRALRERRDDLVRRAN